MRKGRFPAPRVLCVFAMFQPLSSRVFSSAFSFFDQSIMPGNYKTA
jgi:hypothetical protein